MKAIVEKVVSDIMAWLPALLGGILFVLVGLLAAWLTGLLLSKGLKRIGMDRLAEKSGMAGLMAASGFDRPLSMMVGRFGYWVILLIFVLAAAESMGLSIVAGMFNTGLNYAPHVLGALLILLVGGFLAGIIGDAVGALSTESGLKGRSALGRLTKYTLYVLVSILAIQELGVDTLLLSSVVISIVAAIALTLALAFGLGSTQLARNILAGFHARETFTIGDSIKVREHAGKLVRIGTYKFVLDKGTERCSLPNHYLTDDEVIIYPAGA